MLLTIVDTKSHGKFVLHLFPYQPLNPPKDDVTPVELTESLSNAFQYFGIYQKSNVITTSNGSLKEGTIVDLFEANQKYTEVVIGIDENCVLVSKSSFLDSSRQFFQNLQYPTHHIELGEFISLNDQESSIVNSISFVYRQQTYENIEQVKHKLAFLVNVFEIKQKHSKFLSKQILKIIEEKSQFKRILKDKCAMYSKQNNTIYEQFKIKLIYKQIQSEAATIIKKIYIFELLQRIYHSWDKKQFFKSDSFEDQFISCINGINLKVPSIHQSKQRIKIIENKTIITIPPKLNTLPSVFYPNQKIEYIYERILSNNTKPLRSIVSNQLQTAPECVYHTAYFLIKNDLAACVFPYDPQRYYSLYTLRSMPDKKVIAKFNQLFQEDNILEYLKKFQKYYRIKCLDEKIKYLLLNRVIKEILIYVQKLETVNNRQNLRVFSSSIHQIKKPALSKEKIPQNITIAQLERQKQKPSPNSNINIIQSILNKYVQAKPEEINIILGKCYQQKVKMNELINFVKHNSNFWKFIFVQKCI